jgi:pyrroloquinoline-quinone synthase
MSIRLTVIELSQLPVSIPPERAEFVRSLLAIGAQKYHDKHPFHRRMNNGQLSRVELATWATNRFYYQRMIPRKDGAILANMTDPAIRRRWRQRIVEQDGTTEDDAGLTAWLALITALGGDAQRAWDDSAVLPGVRFAVDAYLRFCQTRPWIDAVASSLTELFAPHLHALRVEVFPVHYPWVDQAGLQYFKRRISQANADVSHGLSLVLEHCKGAEAEAIAQQCLSFKCDLLWSLLDAIEHHCACGPRELA